MHISLYFVILLTAPLTWAEPTTSIELKYASVPWNLNSKKIDSAFMFVRDKNTGKVAKINVEESEPDSSLFSGQFSISWEQDKQTIPEVYVPPQNLRSDSRAVEKFNQMLSSGTIKPQPFAQKQENGKLNLEVFDTQEQADRATKAYQQMIDAEKKAEQAKLIKPKLSDSTLEVAKMAAQATALAEMAKAAAAREAQRILLEQIELQKREQLRLEREKLNATALEKKKNQARELSEKANAFYQKGQFAEAEPLYRQATELDPENQDYFFKYGVALYRINKYSEALVTFKMAKVDEKSEVEKKYYMGLIHFKLKELSQALTGFQAVRLANDPTLSPSAAFYEGLVLLTLEDFIPAQAAFEYVLDNSKDPALDKKAEEYIQKIAGLMEFKKMASKKIFLTASLTAMYDSNILLTPDNDSSSGTSVNQEGGLRETLTGSAEYRFFYKEKKDFSAKLSLSDTQSADVDFTTADAFIMNFATPYNYKSTHAGGKAYKLTLTPGYEYMQLHDGNGEPYSALSAVLFNSDYMQIKNENWYSSYNLDLRKDNSLVPESAENNADANKATIKKVETLLLDSSKKRILLASLGFTLNNAEGDEKKYNRFEFNAVYIAPILKFKNTTWSGGISAYKQTYGSSSNDRKDTNAALLFGFNKIFSETWSWAGNASLTDNTSTVSSNDYSKYLIGTSIAYSWSK